MSMCLSIFQLSLAAALLCACSGAPQTSVGAPEVVREYNNVNQDGTYDFGFEYSDGTFKIESKDAEGNVKGSFDSRQSCLLWLIGSNRAAYPMVSMYNEIYPRLRELMPLSQWKP